MKQIFLIHSFSDQKALHIAHAMRRKCDSSGLILSSASDMPTIIGRNFIASIFDQIKQASLVVAVIGDQSSQVLLELGYALGMGKSVILVADLNSNMPFDLSDLQAIDYGIPAEEIAARLLKILEKTQSEIRSSESAVPHDLAEMLRLRNEYPEKFERIPYNDFEYAVKRAFLQKGFTIEEVNPTTDYGFDFKINKGTEGILVEVKKLSPNGKVSIAVVQQLLGAIHGYHAPKAILICTSEFTDSARGFASRHASELSLWTADDLSQFLDARRTI